MSSDHPSAVVEERLCLPDPAPIVAALVKGHYAVAKWFTLVANGIKSAVGLDGFNVIRSITKLEFDPRLRQSEEWQWRLKILKLLDRLAHTRRQNAQDPWVKKCYTLAQCLKLTRLKIIGNTVKVRSSLFRYSTTTWEACFDRMIQGANRAAWRGGIDSWKRWTLTVAKNANRRAEYRDAAA